MTINNLTYGLDNLLLDDTFCYSVVFNASCFALDDGKVQSGDLEIRPILKDVHQGKLHL